MARRRRGSSRKLLINAVEPEESRIAVLHTGKLDEYYIERQSLGSTLGNIYKAKITNVEKSIGAAFVDFGHHRQGFLHVSDLCMEAVSDDAKELLSGVQAAREVAHDEDVVEPQRKGTSARPDGADGGAGELSGALPSPGVDELVAEPESLGELIGPVPEPPVELTVTVGGQPRTAVSASKPIAPAVDDRADEPEVLEELPEIELEALEDDEESSAADADASVDEVDAEGFGYSPDTLGNGEGERGDSLSELDDQEDEDEDGDGLEPVVEAVDLDDDDDDEVDDEVDEDDEDEEGEEGEDEDEDEDEESDEGDEAEAGSRAEIDDAAIAGDRAQEQAGEGSGGDRGRRRGRRGGRRRSRGRDGSGAEGGPAETVEDADERAGQADDSEATAAANGSNDSRRRRGRRGGRGRTRDSGDSGGGSGSGGSTSGGRGAGGTATSSGGGRQGRPARTGGRRRDQRQMPAIEQLLQKGQEIVVQVIKDGIGTKGPTLTTFLSIPGRFIVLMPGIHKRGVSRKVTNNQERERLKGLVRELEAPENLGFIVRTAGSGCTTEDLQRDLDYLLRVWERMQTRITEHKAPVLLYQENDLVIRTLRDLYDGEGDIVIDEPVTAGKAREFLEQIMPECVEKVQTYDGEKPLFSHYGLETELARLLESRLELKSGASLVIEQTEALVAIDVNSGRYKPEVHGDIDLTGFTVNCEAAVEVARQLRLRDLGGVVVIDFIDMRMEKHRKKLERLFKEELRKDRARIKLARFSPFGILELTRQRVRPSLKRTMHQQCPYCESTGFIPSDETSCLNVIRKVRENMWRPGSLLVVTVRPEVSEAVLNTQKKALVELEKVSGKEIFVRADHRLAYGDIEVRAMIAMPDEVDHRRA